MSSKHLWKRRGFMFSAVSSSKCQSYRNHNIDTPAMSRMQIQNTECLMLGVTISFLDYYAPSPICDKFYFVFARRFPCVI